MSRPTDWSILELGSDPVPGDWSDVSRASTRYGTIADSIAQAKRDLIRVFDQEQLSGEAIDAVRETALQVADRIGRAKERYRGVADALAGYIEPLHHAQDVSLNILNNALAANGDRHHAQQEFQEWERKYDDAVASGDQDAIDHARRTRDSWQQKYYESNDDIYGAIAQLNGVIEARDRAANHAAGLIENVENSGDINDDFWDKVDQFYDENEGWIDKAIEIAGYVAAALAIVAMFVPGLNLIVLAVSIIVAAAVILNAWAKAGTGRESIAEAIVTTVLALLPFGVGKVISAVGKPLESAALQAAESTMMHSASGSAISGVTKSVATSVAEAFVERPVIYVGEMKAASSQLEALLNLSSLAKTPLLESSVVQAALGQAADVRVVVNAIEHIPDAFAPALDPVLHSAGNGLVDSVFGEQSANSWQNANW